MKKIWLLLVILCVETAHAAQYIKVTKSDSVIGYKEPTTQSKMLNVFKEGDVVEAVSDKDGWYKVKIPFNQGYFLYGWVLKNSPNMMIVNDANSSDSPVLKNAKKAEPVEVQSRKSTGVQHAMTDLDDQDEKGNHRLRVFGGPVYNIRKYGAFQYRFGLSYEIALTETFKFGVPVSYLTGDGFHSVMGGLETMYSFYFDWFALTPRIGAGFEYFYGNGKSFNAITAEAGPAFEISISKTFTIGVEPLTVQAMVWNSTDTINKVPFNLRGQSLIYLRGRW